MNIRWLKQFAIAFLMVVSLMVPSVSACTCDHHKTEAEHEASSCHHHSDMSEMEEGDGSELQDSSSFLDPDADCICNAAASKVIAKSEGINLKKHVSTRSFEAFLVVAHVRLPDSVTIEFVKPSYLSDSFHNLAPKRGPPRF